MFLRSARGDTIFNFSRWWMRASVGNGQGWYMCIRTEKWWCIMGHEMARKCDHPSCRCCLAWYQHEHNSVFTGCLPWRTRCCQWCTSGSFGKKSACMVSKACKKDTLPPWQKETTQVSAPDLISLQKRRHLDHQWQHLSIPFQEQSVTNTCHL